MLITAHLLVASVTDKYALISHPMYPTAFVHLCKLVGTDGVMQNGCFLSFKGRPKGTQQVVMHSSGGLAYWG